MSDDVPHRIAEILAEALDRDADTITPGEHLADDLGADSLAMIEVVIGVEQAFGVAVPEAELPGLTTVAELTAYVESLLA